MVMIGPVCPVLTLPIGPCGVMIGTYTLFHMYLLWDSGSLHVDLYIPNVMTYFIMDVHPMKSNERLSSSIIIIE